MRIFNSKNVHPNNEILIKTNLNFKIHTFAYILIFITFIIGFIASIIFVVITKTASLSILLMAVFYFILSVIFYKSIKSAQKINKTKAILKINENGFYGYVDDIFVPWEDIEELEINYKINNSKEYTVFVCQYIHIKTRSNNNISLIFGFKSGYYEATNINNNHQKDDLEKIIRQYFTNKVNENNIKLFLLW